MSGKRHEPPVGYPPFLGSEDEFFYHTGYWKLKRKSRLICPIRIKISVTAVLRRRQPCPFTIMYVWIVMPRSKKCSHCLSTTSKKSCARNVAASTLSKRQLLSSQ